MDKFPAVAHFPSRGAFFTRTLLDFGFWKFRGGFSHCRSGLIAANTGAFSLTRAVRADVVWWNLNRQGGEGLGGVHLH